eukprot:994766-Amphidinium_carterae.1
MAGIRIYKRSRKVLRGDHVVYGCAPACDFSRHVETGVCCISDTAHERVLRAKHLGEGCFMSDTPTGFGTSGSPIYVGVPGPGGGSCKVIGMASKRFNSG